MVLPLNHDPSHAEFPRKFPGLLFNAWGLVRHKTPSPSKSSADRYLASSFGSGYQLVLRVEHLNIVDMSVAFDARDVGRSGATNLGDQCMRTQVHCAVGCPQRTMVRRPFHKNTVGITVQSPCEWLKDSRYASPDDPPLCCYRFPPQSREGARTRVLPGALTRKPAGNSF